MGFFMLPVSKIGVGVLFLVPILARVYVRTTKFSIGNNFLATRLRALIFHI